jgi:hypothetical protein
MCWHVLVQQKHLIDWVPQLLMHAFIDFPSSEFHVLSIKLLMGLRTYHF